MSDIALIVGGSAVTGWTQLTVAHSLDQLSRSFVFEVEGDLTEVRGLMAVGAEVSVEVVADGESFPFAEGWIDTVASSLGPEGETLTISGRDKSCDLIDCSAESTSSTWTGSKFSGLMSDLARGYGLTVDASALTADPVIEAFTLQSGESCFSAMERLARSQGVLLITTSEGNVRLTYAGTGRALQALTVGDNVLSVDRTQSGLDRFSSYTGKAINPGKGGRWTAKNTRIVSRVFDPAVERKRNLTFVAESKQDQPGLDRRVSWEAQVRAGRSDEFSAEVVDFFQFASDGSIIGLWQVNEIVALKIDRWNVDRDLLVSGVTFTAGTRGRRTVLTLRDPRTYAPDPGDEVKLD